MKWLEWVRVANSKAEQYSAYRDVSYDNIRTALIDIVILFKDAPGHVEDALRSVGDSQLSGPTSRAFENIERGDFRWNIDPRRGYAGAALDMAAHARALDRLAYERHALRGELTQPEDYLCKKTGFYLVPRPASQLDEFERERNPLANTPSRRQRFPQRCLRFHRIIPSEVHGYDVKLYVPTNISARSHAYTFASAMFSEVEVRQRQNNDKIVIEPVNINGASDIIKEQIRLATVGRCEVLMWPELTITEQSRTVISHFLRGALMRPFIAGYPALVVAGSCHQELEGEKYNAAPVYDAYGELVALHRKCTPYIDNENGAREDIATGKTVTLIATDVALYAVAICKDFCELQIKNPYHAIDVDCILVPSLGGETTLNAHLQAADLVRLQSECRAFVVQQLEKPGTEPGSWLGFAISMPKKALLLRGGDALKQRTTWTAHMPIEELR